MFSKKADCGYTDGEGNELDRHGAVKSKKKKPKDSIDQRRSKSMYRKYASDNRHTPEHDAEKKLPKKVTGKKRQPKVYRPLDKSKRKMDPKPLRIQDASGAVMGQDGIPAKGRKMKKMGSLALEKLAAKKGKKRDLKWYDPLIASPTPENMDEHATLVGRPLGGLAGGALAGGLFGAAVGGEDGAAAGTALGAGLGTIAGAYSANKKVMKGRISKGKDPITKKDLRDQYHAARMGYYQG